ncbi:Glucose-methanol-choline oxidoreductase C-terminal [Penicillium chrysogenum]|uniref:Glucose-methanol-choline oxidoreductase C-terminal n=1 Tax=Penicillium chrysogenum TaxID=5076 RepID=A0ABQ8WBQ3_PENCH|nr:Glucose-methanol-choline oxidoreductase C-terminal [Penicillium chrysogenum]KAJ5237913.1 Glucose-methanol-choline oxidoreductase C-terminal [Penicillium chrysogenum]KAJ5261826.1 Glucose-methanol-choline oxidoreductase C-terminal [Penicillium chrysogenum]KAJ6159754.1 Glucose-methanol-choline oxidoreductase C-terminal [Penicillium chrysogenum]
MKWCCQLERPKRSESENPFGSYGHLRAKYTQAGDYRRIKNSSVRGKGPDCGSSLNNFTYVPGSKVAFDMCDEYGGNKWARDPLCQLHLQGSPPWQLGSFVCPTSQKLPCFPRVHSKKLIIDNADET